VTQKFSKESVELGRQTFETFCARCHGVDATGGTVKRFTPPGSKTPIDFQAPNLHEIHKDDPNVANLAWRTIQQGRPGTPMPTWGVRYGGAMNDQQITNLVNYLLSIQSDGKQRPQLDFKALSNREAVALVRALRAG
jgi:mono/diheme cytochrome c family protein